MNQSPVLIAINALFAGVFVISLFMRNHFLRKLSVQNRGAIDLSSKSPNAHTPKTGTPHALALLERKARVATVTCGIGAVGAVITNLVMQATAGP